ncbi:MAG: tryptophan 7-halogenase [Streptosporangiaceae bacterium]
MKPTLVAMRGHRVVLLEKEKFPRWQIGESLLPSTVHGICRLTGVADELAKAGFTKKRGGTQRWGANPEPWTFAFSVSPKMAGETSYAYQVERSKFDHILLDHARHMGVDVREQHAVRDVIEDEGRVRGVAYTDAAGNPGTIHAQYVVDASGNNSRIYQRTGATRQYSEFFRSLALFGYFEGGKRLPEPNSGNVLSCAFDSGWFWYIPLSPTLTSVGAVVRHEMASKIQGDPEQAFTALIAECPMISDYLRDATRVTHGQYGQLRVRKDYSYANTTFWRSGMVLVGDAACFVDPVFSSGVHLATYGALLAARSINSVLDQTTDENTAFHEFEQRYRREFGVYYEFLVAFYDLNVNEDSYFWSAKKVTDGTSSDLQSFVELVGGVSSGESALADHYKRRSSEFASAVEQLVANNEQSMVPIIKSSIVNSAMQEGAKEQARVLLGQSAGTAIPLFNGGLITSPDGLSWSLPA